jgi:multiple sugar transport system permease protein
MLNSPGVRRVGANLAEEEGPGTLARTTVQGVQAADALPRGRRGRRGVPLLGPDWLPGYLLVSPAIFYIAVLVAYPFFLSLYFSLSNVTVSGGDNGFVGLTNYVRLFQDPTFLTALRNSISFTFFSEIGKGVLGVGLAFLLLQAIRGKKIIRGFLMIPFTMPLSLALLGWKWMYDPQFSVINRVFGDMLHVMKEPFPVWLGDPLFSWFAILIVNIWRGFPFAAVIVLAGLTSIPKDILEAARADGAGFFRTWHYVIVPMIAPILFIGLIYDVTFTLGDITIVDILTEGGPGGATEILPMLSFQTGIQGGNLSFGAADALVLFPILFAGLILFLRMLFRRTAEA